MHSRAKEEKVIRNSDCKSAIRNQSQRGQALIELAMTLTFFVVTLLFLDQLVQAYKSKQQDRSRLTYDVSRKN